MCLPRQNQALGYITASNRGGDPAGENVDACATSRTESMGILAWIKDVLLTGRVSHAGLLERWKVG